MWRVVVWGWLMAPGSCRLTLHCRASPAPSFSPQNAPASPSSEGSDPVGRLPEHTFARLVMACSAWRSEAMMGTVGGDGKSGGWVSGVRGLVVGSAESSRLFGRGWVLRGVKPFHTQPTRLT